MRLTQKTLTSIVSCMSERMKNQMIKTRDLTQHSSYSHITLSQHRANRWVYLIRALMEKAAFQSLVTVFTAPQVSSVNTWISTCLSLLNTGRGITGCRGRLFWYILKENYEILKPPMFSAKTQLKPPHL